MAVLFYKILYLEYNCLIIFDNLLNMNEILKSCKFVSENSKHVKINENKLVEFTKHFSPENIQHWFAMSPFDLTKLDSKELLNFLLIFNSLNFSYWGKPKWEITYQGQKIKGGSYCMITSLGKAIENDFSILDAKYLSQISENDLAKILEGTIEIPLFQERLQIIREVGKSLLANFSGNFFNLIKQSNNDSQKIIELLIKYFPSFKDETNYKGQQIYFYKRAQILINDISQTSKEPFCKIKNIEELTACADYKVPFVLRRLGILEYNEQLSHKIDNNIELKKDSEEEIEIRANTVWANEIIKQKVQEKFPDITAIQINDALWLEGRKDFPNDKPHHLTRTTAY
ncbi:MAG: hypothetical protein A2507_05090 [Candidatus Magasanikbacteria bacterium RIFOXYD12_FULL_33_17]|nr:MAG: hypothetical protein A2507_05090 [Candidatus Magasanikbacteria bacterium RIFOXYD12_FULL_33_17]